MSSLFLKNDSMPVLNEDGSLAVVYVVDVDLGKGEVSLAPQFSSSSIMARSVTFHTHRLLEPIIENGLGPTCEILVLRLKLLTERAKAHIQRQLTYASNCKLYLVSGLGKRSSPHILILHLFRTLWTAATPSLHRTSWMGASWTSTRTL